MKNGKLKVLTAVLAVLTLVSMGLFIFGGRLFGKDKTPVTETKIFSLAESRYTGRVSVAGEGGNIFLPTDVGGVYYTAKLSGEVNFWSFDGTAFTRIPAEIKTMDIKINTSFEALPVRLYYFDTGSGLVGCGVFTAQMDESVKFNPYVFVTLKKMPKGYGDGCLLLASFDPDEFYKPDKTYGEIYTFDERKNSYFTAVSQNTRLIASDGLFRKDWLMMTDEFISNLGDAKYFMSSRYYTEEETGRRTDIMVYSNAYRPTVVYKDILGEWFVNDGDTRYFLRKTDEGFKSVCVAKDKGEKDEKDIAVFEGDYFENYLRSGDYVADRRNGAVTNLKTGETSRVNADISKADSFSIGPDGSRAVFAVSAQPDENGTPVQTLIYCSLDGSVMTEVYSEPMLFSEASGFVWIDGSTVMSVRPLTDDGSEAGSVIYRIN